MTTKTMLGLVVLAIGLSTIPAFAESETILSPNSSTIQKRYTNKPNSM